MGWYGNSSGAAGGWYGSSSGGKKPKPKKPKGHSVGGFLGNLVDDIQETATSLVPGLVATGASVLHDAGRPFGLTHGQYQSDDIIKSIVKSYTDKGTFFGELGRAQGQWLTGDPSDTWKHLKRAGGAFYDNPFGPILDVASLVTMGGGAAAKGASLMGKGVDASKLARRVGTEELGYTRKLSKNPVIRARQNAFESVAQRLPETTPMVGTTRRIGRHTTRLERRNDARIAAAEAKPAREATRGLKGVERDAVPVVAGGHDIHEMIAHETVRERMVSEEMARKTAAGRKRGENSLVVDEDGTVRRAKTDEELTYEGDGLQGLLNADRMDDLKTNGRNLAAIRTRKGLLEKVRDSGVLDDPKRRLKIDRAAKAINEMAAASTRRAVKKSSDPLTALERPLLESSLMQMTGATERAYVGAIRSHVRAPSVRGTRAGTSAPRHTKPGKVAELQHNTGYNSWNSLDDFSIDAYFRAHKNLLDAEQRVRRFDELASKATRMSPHEAARLERDGVVKILSKNADFMRDADLVARLWEDAKHVLGDTEGHLGINAMLEDALALERGDGLVAVVPAGYYKELVGEFKAASKFTRILIDNPTRVWRGLTLTFRPAWIVNNFIGQMFLLAVSHGVKGLKNYVMQFGGKGKKFNKVIDDLAPELSDWGWAHDFAKDGLKGGNFASRKIRRAADFMGNLNQRLTDDYTRKAAFRSTIDPHIKALRKKDPSLSYEDAARKLWEDPAISDEVTSKVLSDMVDFGDLSDFERQYVKRAIPFYAWISGMTKRTARLVADEPWKAAIATRLSEQGAQNLEDKYGDLPRFLKGMVGVGGDKVLVTNGMNPFMTPADVVGMFSGTALAGRSDGTGNPLAQFNPVIKSPLEAWANRDFFYGGDLDPKGAENSTLGRLFTDMKKNPETGEYERQIGGRIPRSFPQFNVFDEWRQEREMNKTGLEYDPTFTPSTRNALASYFGVPIRTLDIQAANSRALRDA